MRTLLVLRHAKARNAGPGAADAARPLTTRGRDDARGVAAYLGRSALAPALVLCSPALRARQTLEEVAVALPAEAEVSVEDELYLAGCGQLLERLRRVEARARSVLLVGHNPGLRELVEALAGSGAALADVRRGFPTATLAVLTLPLDSWDGVELGGAALTACVSPRRPA